MTADLRTRYLGLELANPLIASASPLSNTLAGVRQLAEAGVGAIVLYSLFEEQVRREAEQNAARADAGTESFAEALSYFPAAADADHTPRQYLRLVERAAATVDIPVIASLNAVTAGGWAGCATALERAGAAAIELNIYQPLGEPVLSGREAELRHVEILQGVKAAVRVPVAVKLHPYFSSIAEMAHRLDSAGADGLVLFNRFLQPDIDPESLTVSADFGLSHPDEARLPRAWIALLAGRVRASLAATTGVADAADVARYLLAGADVVMTASALLRNGPNYATDLLDGLVSWMSRKGFGTVADVRGLVCVPADAQEAARERTGYVGALRAANIGQGKW
jgi:dihydroorotate dehydrogenase (fumarate)